MSSILFGGASLGEGAFSTDESMAAIYDTLAAAEISRIDTARRYPKSSPGCSEQLLGSTGAIKRGFAIDTKINVTSVGQSGGSLSKNKIKESVAASSAALRDDRVGVKLDFPVSILFPWEFSEDQRLLRSSFIADCPLAGGFLTGKLSLGQDLGGSRYADGNPMGASYRPMYDKRAMHTAVKELYSSLQSHGIELAEASLRWVYYHSALHEGDGVILGASNIAQIKENMRWITRGPLEKNIVAMFEEMWEKVQYVAP
ncbi:MAG: hypothetical protein Q9214_000620 [Letrouitia sp. 1 TL-2023]